MNDTLYEKEIRRLESVVHDQNNVIDQQYTTILQLESKLREYEHMEKVKRI